MDITISPVVDICAGVLLGLTLTILALSLYQGVRPRAPVAHADCYRVVTVDTTHPDTWAMSSAQCNRRGGSLSAVE